jgi:hypothetical protein
VYASGNSVNVFLVGFDVLTAMVMKSPIYWDNTRSFGGTCRLHLQVLRIKQERYKLEILRKNFIPELIRKESLQQGR